VPLDAAARIDLAAHPDCGGGGARWFRLRDVPPGQVIRVTNGPEGGRDGRVTRIEVSARPPAAGADR
jgi:hypothetical protein